MLEKYQKCFLVGYRFISLPSIIFLKYYPFKSCEEKNFIPNIQILFAAVAEYAELNLLYVDIMWNEI
jgi:hypothetical protein